MRGQTLDEATSMLADEDLAVGSVIESYSSSVAAGNVISQGIAPDTKVERNTAVNLEISLGEKPYAVVPDVRGETLDTASTSLANAKLNVAASPIRNRISQRHRYQPGLRSEHPRR